ncbi:hypothetical protein MKX08_009781 [Trichoderma sp. CBMAI-0020]|nr:hypothetical protein MKX08_009781 [Trichoderma sp. CBMAI-0020]
MACEQPKTVKQWNVEGFGGFDGLKFSEQPLPELGDVKFYGGSKVAALKRLGADHVISYKDDRKWGETAKTLTGGRGVDIIVQVAGVNEME